MHTNYRQIAFSCLFMSVPILFFAYQFIIRVMPSLLTDKLMQQFCMDASQFGFLSSVYYLGIAVANIPVSLMLVRYPPGFVISVASILLGALLFIFYNLNDGILGVFVRFLTGVFSSVGFMAVSRMALNCFSRASYGVVMSCSITFGLFGAFLGGAPLGKLISIYGLDKMITVLVVLSWLIAAASLFLPRHSKTEEEAKLPVLCFSCLKEVFCSGNLILLGFASVLMMGLGHGFADLWGVPYLVASYSISKAEAALIVGCTVFGVMAGGPVMSLFGRRFGNANVILVSGIMEATVFLYVLLYHASFDVLLLKVFMFGLGFFSASKVLFFPICVELSRPSISTVAVAYMGFIFMAGGLLFHATLGLALDYVSRGVELACYGCYSSGSLRSALLIIPIACSAGAILTILITRVFAVKTISSGGGASL